MRRRLRLLPMLSADPSFPEITAELFLSPHVESQVKPDLPESGGPRAARHHAGL